MMIRHLKLSAILAPLVLFGIASVVVLKGIQSPLIFRGEPTAYLFPVLSAALVAALCLVEIIRLVIEARETVVTRKPDLDEDGDSDDPINIRRLLSYIGILLIFAIFLNIVGIYALVALCFPPLLYWGEKLSLRTSLILPLVTVLIVAVLFSWLLGVDLPTGRIFDSLIGL